MGIVAPIPVKETTQLPSLDPPNDPELVHVFLRSTPGVGLCGANPGNTHRDCPAFGTDYLNEKFCPDCGRPVCPACRAMAAVDDKLGFLP